MASKVFGGEVAIGVFAYQGERAATSDWSPVIRHLNQALPAHHFALINMMLRVCAKPLPGIGSIW